MSFLNPTLKPVTLYRVTDADAPQLTGAANDILTVMKACLATGYGIKTGAGWTVEYEDATAGKLVLKAAVTSDRDIYLRISGDTGTKANLQVFSAMTDIDTGDNELTDPDYGYAVSNRSGKWAMVASDRAFWLFCESRHSLAYPAAKRGTFCFVGDTLADFNGVKGVFLAHSGKRLAYGLIANGTGANYKNTLSLQILQAGAEIKKPASNYPFAGNVNVFDDLLLAPVMLVHDSQPYVLPGVHFPSNIDAENYTQVDNVDNNGVNESYIVANISPYQQNSIYVKLNEWEM